MRNYQLLIVLLSIIIVSIIYITMKGDEKMVDNNFSITSSVFKNGDIIPVKYTGQGMDISMPLKFDNISSLGKSIAIIMDDPDTPVAGSFTHWLIWNIPVAIKEIPENIPNDEKVSILGGAIQGKNDFGKIGYMGPNPPSGTHTYKIKAYVLDSFLNLKTTTSKSELENNIKNHIIQSALLEGKFSHQ